MVNVILWGTGVELNAKINLIKYYEADKKINVIGITSRMTSLNKVYGYRYIEKSEIKKLNFDAIIVVSKKFYDEIQNEIINMGIDRRLIWDSEVLLVPSFDFEKYRKLKFEPVTLFSQNCWGGVTYNSLSLEFSSPLVNMFFWDADMIRFLKRPQHYVNAEIDFLEYFWDDGRKCYYPVGMCDDVRINFLHYFDFKEAVATFKRRAERINWDNIAVEMATEDRKVIDEFLQLPYKKKICFVPYEIGVPECIKINYDKVRDNNMLSASMAVTHGFLDAISWLVDGEISIFKEYM